MESIFLFLIGLLLGTVLAGLFGMKWVTKAVPQFLEGYRSAEKLIMLEQSYTAMEEDRDYAYEVWQALYQQVQDLTVQLEQAHLNDAEFYLKGLDDMAAQYEIFNRNGHLYDRFKRQWGFYNQNNKAVMLGCFDPNTMTWKNYKQNQQQNQQYQN